MNPLSTPTMRLAMAGALLPAFATPAHAGPTPPPPAAAAATLIRAEPTAAELEASLKKAIDATNEDPEVHAPALRTALDEVAAVPGVVGRSAKLQGLRIDGLLYLARAQLVLDERDDAVSAIDEAIRVSGGSIANISDFGPSLAGLYDERRAAPELRPAGEIQVACTGGPCRVFLDGRVIGTGTDITASGIPLGPHVLRIEPQELNPPEPFQQQVITLTDDAPTLDFDFEVPAPDTLPTAGDVTPAGDAGSGRKLPRWAGILGMTLGGLAIAGGAFALAIDGRCPDLSDPEPDEVGGDACRDVYTTTGTGIGVLAAGVAAGTGFGIAFGLGERKDKRYRERQRSGTEASLQLRFRF